jgi:cell division protein FtsI (penicillin-binding protein 3)
MQSLPSKWRFRLCGLCLCALPIALVWHLAHLQVLPGQEKGYLFLQEQGLARTLRTEKINAYRGVIMDRNGELLAVSTPVMSIFANPQRVESAQVPSLAEALGMSEKALRERLKIYADKQFVYLERHLPPQEAAPILAMNFSGVSAEQEYQRYYPSGEVAAHIVGFTDISDRGQEGMELALDEWLSGAPGAKQVVKDLHGNIVRNLGLVRASESGKDVRLSIDLRLQYLAYRELKAAVAEQNAKAGSLVILDVATGEILAMVNQPSYNPNDRSQLHPQQLRNRAITDVLEPGSTLKPFTVMAALETGRYTPETKINTHPGYLQVGEKTLLDHRNYGIIDVTTVLTKSSQVGVSKIALDLDPQRVPNLLQRVGLGSLSGTGFPGERLGVFPNPSRWSDIERAALAFGHGISVTALQLAQAYATIASGGVRRPVSLLKGVEMPDGEQVVSEVIAHQVRDMLKTVTQSGGTATRAQIPAYGVAGKTGTAHKVGETGYLDHKYVALFAGMAPADNPRLVAVVIIDEPKDGGYYGGEAAAPVFANVVEGALRLLHVPPGLDTQIAQSGF